MLLGRWSGCPGRSDIDIVFTGLRPGEKLAEELFSPAEIPHPTAHPLVSRVEVPPLGKAEVQSARLSQPEQSRDWMCCREHSPRCSRTPIISPSCSAGHERLRGQ